MGAKALIHELHRRGICIQADGDRLVVEGALTDRDRAAIRTHKPELLKALRAANDSGAGTAPDLGSLLAEATRGVEIRPGEPFTADMFKALLTPEDIADIEAGDISVHTLAAYARSFAGNIRAGIIELPMSLDYDGGVHRCSTRDRPGDAGVKT